MHKSTELVQDNSLGVCQLLAQCITHLPSFQDSCPGVQGRGWGGGLFFPAWSPPSRQIPGSPEPPVQTVDLQSCFPACKELQE